MLTRNRYGGRKIVNVVVEIAGDVVVEGTVDDQDWRGMSLIGILI